MDVNPGQSDQNNNPTPVQPAQSVPISETVIPPIPSPPHSKKFISIKIAVIVILLAGICAFLFLKNTSKQIASPVNLEPTSVPVVSPIPSPVNSGYFMTGSLNKGNYVYGGAMQLAVNELNTNILHEKLQLQFSPTDQEGIRLLSLFNSSAFTAGDLDEKSYYVKSGYGQQTVDIINKESRAKFPSKSFGDLQAQLGPKDIISYAYFLKQVEYVTQFDKSPVTFLGKSVSGFSASSGNQKNNIIVINYISDDKFIIKLELKDESDEMFLAKGYSMEKPSEAIDVIQKHAQSTDAMGSSDVFEAPDVHLDYSREYIELEGRALLNPAFMNNGYAIGKMTEKMKFDMDNKGARVENEGVILIPAGGAFGGEEPKIKQFILDKPYWILMKRTSSQNPYFILGINNTELLSINN